MSCDCETDLPGLSKEVAARLTAEFSSQFTAKHNSQVVYDITKLATLQVDVYPVDFGVQAVIRKHLTQEMSLHVAIQKRAPTQDEEDLLTQLSIKVLNFLVRKRYQDNKLYSTSGSFIAATVFDKVAKYKENVFHSLMEIRFKRQP